MSRFSSLALVALLASLVVGCSYTPEIVPSTGKHPPMAFEDVKFYQKAPKKYEIVGDITLPITEVDRMDDHGNATPAFNKLLKKAGEMGANGVLLQADPGTYNLLVLAGFHGEWLQVPVKLEPKTVVCKGIFVHEEK